MEKKYILPGITFLSGILLWIILFIIFTSSGWGTQSRFSAELIIAGIPALLIFLSGILCRQADGPRVGNFIRSGILIIFAALSLWKISITAMSILLAAAILLFLIALFTPAQAEKE